MGLAVVVMLALLLASCAIPSQRHPWCAPDGRYHRDTHEFRAGVRCYW